MIELKQIPIFLSTFLFLTLLFFRKTFSYIQIGPLYIIEVVMIIASLVYVLVILLNSGNIYLDKRSLFPEWIIGILIFFSFSILRAALSETIDLQNLIPGIYPFYIVLTFLFALQINNDNLWKYLKFMAIFLIISSLIPYANNYIFSLIIGPIESPGWTYIYAVSIVLSLFMIEKMHMKMFFISLSFIGILSAFQRGTFVNMVIAGGYIWFLLKRNLEERSKVQKVIKIGFILLITIFLLFPVISKIILPEGGRFDITLKNMIGFITSIFTSDVSLSGTKAGAAVAGTRNHRLNMWMDALRVVWQRPDYLLWGAGYTGTVGQGADVTFRNVHNGFVTIVYRNGFLGLIIFIMYTLAIVREFKNRIDNHIDSRVKKVAILGLVSIMALLGDMLTGTIIDSPFTSFISYVTIGFSLAYIYNQRVYEINENTICA